MVLPNPFYWISALSASVVLFLISIFSLLVAWAHYSVYISQATHLLWLLVSPDGHGNQGAQGFQSLCQLRPFDARGHEMHPVFGRPWGMGRQSSRKDGGVCFSESHPCLEIISLRLIFLFALLKNFAYRRCILTTLNWNYVHWVVEFGLCIGRPDAPRLPEMVKCSAEILMSRVNSCPITRFIVKQ